ncbi:uncharacterized protein LOC142323680 [Lycorma delicatula]|uniref:uncharacterized protein LOC142323680 n=1 Tax=Lycorma delicatula TaxID=130591 RepID=UPI003F51A5DA
MDSKCNGNNNKMYKATKIWNECIYLFKNGMPVKRHRYHVRVFPDTFTGEEATNWLYGTLKTNSYFSQDVTKMQVIQLLNKFFKSGVFEGIKPMKNFKAGKQLYRFKCTTSTQVRDPLAVLSQNFDDKNSANENNSRFSNHSDGLNFKNHQKIYGDNKICDKPYKVFRYEENLSKTTDNNLAGAGILFDNSEDKMVFSERDSLQKLGNQLKIEVNQEQQNREDLKRDFLRLFITENGEVNQNVQEMKTSPKTFSLTSETNFDSHHSIPVKSMKSHIAPNDNFENYLKQLKSKYLGEYLMKSVLERINSILGPYLNLNDIISCQNIDPIWILNNMDANIENTYSNLPSWILDAAACLGFFGETAEEEKYPGYCKDVYSVLCENMIVQCKTTLIPIEMNELFLSTFNFLEELNKTKSVNVPNSIASSTEELIYNMITPVELCRNEGIDNLGFIMPLKNYSDVTNNSGLGSYNIGNIVEKELPTDCCYETAFTSDVPVTRIIRHKTRIKRAQSVLLLNENHLHEPVLYRTPKSSSSTSLKWRSYQQSHLKYNFIDNMYHSQNFNKVSRETGSCNAGNKISDLPSERTHSISASSRSHSCDNLKTVHKSGIKNSITNIDEEERYNCYVNYGLSQSIDDCTASDASNFHISGERNGKQCSLNYIDALKDIDRLVEFSKLSKDPSLSNYRLRSCDELNIEPLAKTSFQDEHSVCLECKSLDSDSYNNITSVCLNKMEDMKWLPSVMSIGFTLFGNELLLLQPESREKLKILLFLIQQFNVILGKNNSENKSEVLEKLVNCVIRSRKNDFNETKAIYGMIKFLVEHRETVMEYSDSIDHPLFIEQNNEVKGHALKKNNEINADASDENNRIKMQCSNAETQLYYLSEDNTENSHFKLIYHILNDKKCSKNDKKMLLKMLGDVYSDIESDSTVIQSKVNASKAENSKSESELKKVAMQKLRNLRI